MKTLLCMLNGLSDEPLAILDGQTPLQKAPTPTLDRLVQCGGGLSIQPPQGGGLETAFLSLLGVTESLPAFRQGPLEAQALGIPLEPQQRAYCFRFVSLGSEIVVDVTDQLLSDSEGKLLCQGLTAHFSAQGWSFHPLRGPRAICVTEHPIGNRALTFNPYNPVRAMEKRWWDLLPVSAQTNALKEMAQYAAKWMTEHEVNAVRLELGEPLVNGFLLYNGGASLPQVESSPALSPQRVCLCTRSPSFTGAAALFNIDVRPLAPEARKFASLPSLVEQSRSLLSHYDLLLLDIEYLWRSTYKGDILEKVKTIEFLDRTLLKPLFAFAEEEGVRLCVMPLRHSSIATGELLTGPVPCAVYSPGIQTETWPSFDERCAQQNASRALPLHAFLTTLFASLSQHSSH